MEANNIIFLNFADNRIPEFKEVKSKDWILFGTDNLFPEQLLYLFNKSSNHNAIINGKVTYILGKGFAVNPPVNNGETLNKVTKKYTTDIELFGGMFLQFNWKIGGQPEIIHVPFQTIRKAKDRDGYYYCKNWNWKAGVKVEPVYIPPFDPTKKQGSQLFCYREYRPGCDIYPLPGYFGALNDIETDVEISKYNLSVIKNGMFASKMIVFNNGTPTNEQKRELEKAFKNKFAGSENSGNFMLVFNEDPTKAPVVNDLSTTDLDKLFDQLNKTTQAEIFSGHQVTSPMLFGIMEPGKLGGRNEIQDSYEIFKNTYINDKQMAIEEITDFLSPYIGVSVGQKLQPVDPIGIILDTSVLANNMTKDEIRDKAGLPAMEKPQTTEADAVVQALTSLSPLVANKVLESMSENEIRSLIGLPAKAGGDIPVQTINPQTGLPEEQSMVNDNIKNLTGRQHQQLLRIIRQYGQGKITKEIAKTLLKTGLGLGDIEIESMLADNLSMSANELHEDIVAEMFATIGQPKEEFTIIKQKHKFESEELMFKNINENDSNIIDLIQKDKRITADVIAKALKEDVEYVRSRINSLTKSGVLTKSSQSIGVDTIIEHTINPEQIDHRPAPETADVYVRYSYEPKPGLQPVIETTRPFCKKLIELNRIYTRAEIESISQRVGFSVWDRKGGFWGDKEECRHRWVANIVVKKKK